jgi:hypothetical protein
VIPLHEQRRIDRRQGAFCENDIHNCTLYGVYEASDALLRAALGGHVFRPLGLVFRMARRKALDHDR